MHNHIHCQTSVLRIVAQTVTMTCGLYDGPRGASWNKYQILTRFNNTVSIFDEVSYVYDS